MSEAFDLGQQVLQSQPFSRLLGTQFGAFDGTTIELRLPITADLFQQHGFVHGGVISYMADNTLTFAGAIALGPAVVTAEYSIHYVKPARGQDLVARASVISAGRRQAVCRCDVWAVADGKEELCATAQGTIVSVG